MLFLAALNYHVEFPCGIRIHPPKLTPKREESASAAFEWPDLPDA